MAKENNNANTVPDQPAKEKKGSGLKTLIVLLAVILLEAGAFGLGAWLLRGPAETRADSLTADAEAEENRPVELLVVKEKFENKMTGRSFLYDTEIYVIVRRRDEKTSQELIDNRQAQLATEIATVFRRAEPAHFREPTLATLTRQIKSVLDERFGADAEGEPVISEVLIRKCIEFPAHY